MQPGAVPEVFYYTTKAHTVTDSDLSFWTKMYIGNKTNDIFIYSDTDAPIILLKKGTLVNNKQNTVFAKYLFIRPTDNDGTVSNFRGVESPVSWKITITDEVCTDATFSSSGGVDGAHYLDTRGNYSTPYIPTAPGHPATKQYVDDMVINKLGGEY